VELRALADLPLLHLWAAGVVTVFLLLVSAWWRSGAVRRRLRAQSLRAVRGEDRAEVLLDRAGWRIVGRQVSQRYELEVDGKRVSVLVRADFIVRRNGRRYVAEVKTGKLAPRIETPSTRRQLLEYRVVFGVDGVLLVDAESERISFVEFPVLAHGRPSFRPAWWAVAAGLVVAVVAVVSRP
jgi:membrane protein implicated in regulation of membrane protease activity